MSAMNGSRHAVQKVHENIVLHDVSLLLVTPDQETPLTYQQSPRVDTSKVGVTIHGAVTPDGLPDYPRDQWIFLPWAQVLRIFPTPKTSELVVPQIIVPGVNDQ